MFLQVITAKRTEQLPGDPTWNRVLENFVSNQSGESHQTKFNPRHTKP